MVPHGTMGRLLCWRLDTGRFDGFRPAIERRARDVSQGRFTGNGLLLRKYFLPSEGMSGGLPAVCVMFLGLPACRVKQVGCNIWRRRGGGRGVSHAVHGLVHSRMTIDPRIPTMPGGRGTWFVDPADVEASVDETADGCVVLLAALFWLRLHTQGSRTGWGHAYGKRRGRPRQVDAIVSRSIVRSLVLRCASSGFVFRRSSDLFPRACRSVTTVNYVPDMIS